MTRRSMLLALAGTTGELWVLPSHKGRQYPSRRIRRHSQKRMLKELLLLMDSDNSLGSSSPFLSFGK